MFKYQHITALVCGILVFFSPMIRADSQRDNTPTRSASKSKTVSPPEAPEHLDEFLEQPAQVQKLLKLAFELSKQRLGYQYGSSDPRNGGLDCSGTVQYLLQQSGIRHVPRQANTLFQWVSQDFRQVSSRSLDRDLEQLQPGDLLFWNGTYSIRRYPDVTHVMMYLGTDRKTGKRWMMGANSGRVSRRGGVDIFLLDLNRKSYGTSANFLGYGSIPGLR
jgi:hypothetical protein